MQTLLDTCVSALIVSDCRDRDPVHRLQRAAHRVEQLLHGLGFVETAKTLRRYREECGEFPRDPPRLEPVTLAAAADPCDEDPLPVRKARRKAVGDAV